MKKVIAEWLELKPEFKVEKYESFLELLDDNDYIGFVPESAPKSVEEKYMIVQFGGSNALAVRPDSWLTPKENQKNLQGQYFIFDSSIELLEWMLEI